MLLKFPLGNSYVYSVMKSIRYLLAFLVTYLYREYSIQDNFV